MTGEYGLGGEGVLGVSSGFISIGFKAQGCAGLGSLAEESCKGWDVVEEGQSDNGAVCSALSFESGFSSSVLALIYGSLTGECCKGVEGLRFT